MLFVIVGILGVRLLHGEGQVILHPDLYFLSYLHFWVGISESCKGPSWTCVAIAWGFCSRLHHKCMGVGFFIYTVAEDLSYSVA